MADDKEGNKPDQAGNRAAVSEPSIPPNPETVTQPQIPPGIPPITPAGIPQLMAVQLGIGMQQQNPEVVRHMTEFLSHDSDNRLKALQSSGERNQRFRMSALLIGAGLMSAIVVVPLFVQLWRGDMTFVNQVLTSYLPVLGAVILALFAGAKVTDFFRG
jgi:hypothetical protein